MKGMWPASTSIYLYYGGVSMVQVFMRPRTQEENPVVSLLWWFGFWERQTQTRPAIDGYVTFKTPVSGRVSPP